jgi:hypothetical protein
VPCEKSGEIGFGEYATPTLPSYRVRDFEGVGDGLCFVTSRQLPAAPIISALTIDAGTTAINLLVGTPAEFKLPLGHEY